MSRYLVDQIEGTENIEVLVNSEVAAVVGSGRLEAVTVRNRESGESETLPGDAMFIFIGAAPRAEFVADLVERDQAGFILTGPDSIQVTTGGLTRAPRGGAAGRLGRRSGLGSDQLGPQVPRDGVRTGSL